MRMELIKKGILIFFADIWSVSYIPYMQEDQEFWTQEFFEEDDNDFAYEEEEASSSSVCLVDVRHYVYPRCQEWCAFFSFILESTTFLITFF